MTLWGEPEQVHVQNMKQLHVHECHQNLIEHRTTSGNWIWNRIYRPQNPQTYAQHNSIDSQDPHSMVHERGQQQCCLQPTSRLPGSTNEEDTLQCCPPTLHPLTHSTGPPGCAVLHDHGSSVLTRIIMACTLYKENGSGSGYLSQCLLHWGNQRMCTQVRPTLILLHCKGRQVMELQVDIRWFTQLQVNQVGSLGYWTKHFHQINICKLSREGSRKYQYVTQSSGTPAFVSACLCKLGMELRVQYSLVQMSGETRLDNIRL